MKNKIVQVGIGVIIFNDNKLLLGKRLAKYGNNTWSLPGGKPEFGESLEQAAIREVKEETNLNISELLPLVWTNDIFEDDHFVTLFYYSKVDSGELKTMEPNKCEGWEWFDKTNIPYPLFNPLDKLLKDLDIFALQKNLGSEKDILNIPTIDAIKENCERCNYVIPLKI